MTMSSIAAWIAVVAALFTGLGITAQEETMTIHLVFSNHLVRRMPLRNSQASIVVFKRLHLRYYHSFSRHAYVTTTTRLATPTAAATLALWINPNPR